MQIFTVRKRKLRKFNVLTPVCPSFCSRGGGGEVCTPSSRQTPPGQTPPWADTPRQTATAAGGTHPTGMHSCFRFIFQIYCLITGRNEVLAKVIFSQACVCPQGGCLVPGGCLFWGGSSKCFGGGVFLGGFLQIFRGGVFFGGGSSNFLGGSSKFSGVGSSKFFLGGVFLWGGGSPPEYGQRSAGTHPTGMHSCFVTEFVFLRKGDLGGFSINYRLANQTVHLQGQETTITGWRISDEKVENLIVLLLP